MAVHDTHIFSPQGFQELFSALKSYPDAVLWAGGTLLLHGQGERLLSLPRTLISLNGIGDLKGISRTERYLEVGAMATVGRLLKLEKILPPLLVSALRTLSPPHIRNLATIGGNLACQERRLDLYGPLMALDALVELRSASAARWLPLSRFAPGPGSTALKTGELITRIRIPLETWSQHIYHKRGPQHWLTDETATLTLLARTHKETISDLHFVYAGKSLVRDRELENQLVGKTLPLSRREARAWTDKWRTEMLSSKYPDEISPAAFSALVEHALLALLPIDPGAPVVPYRS